MKGGEGVRCIVFNLGTPHVNSQSMLTKLVKCEMSVVQTLKFQFFVYPEELDAAYRCLVLNGGSHPFEMWRHVEEAREMAVLECTNTYVVYLSTRSRFK